MITVNALQAAAALERIHRNQIPFALSNALRETVQGAQVEAAKGAQDAFDRPTKIITKQGKGGAIRARWDNKRDIKEKGVRQASASVFVIDPLVEELHLQVFGGTTRSVPDTANTVLTPTRAVLKGLAGRGRLRRLNKFGNIAGLLRGALGKAKNDTEFLNVPINGAAPQVKHLFPGLYIRVFKDARTRRARGFARAGGLRDQRRRNRRGQFERGSGEPETTLVMLIAYEQRRTFERKFKYDQIVLRHYAEHFNTNFVTSFIQALRTAR